MSKLKEVVFLLVNQTYYHLTLISFIISVFFILGCQPSQQSAQPPSSSQLNQDKDSATPIDIAPSPIQLIAGTYSRKGGEGIYGFSYDPKTASLSNPILLAQTENPSFIHIESNRLYVVNELGRGRISTYGLQADSLLLEQLNSTHTNGASPCYVSMSPDKQFLAVANYMGGNLSIFHVDSEGIPLPNPQILQHTGKGPNKSRQESPHAHWVQWDKTQDYLYAVDLGIDEVKVYTFDSDTGEAGEGKAALKLSPGSGPRHLYFHPNKPLVYILNELSNTIVVAEKSGDGTLAAIQTIETLPASFMGHNQAGHIYITVDGKTLYVSNRGHNSIAAFGIDDSGRLSFLDAELTQGNWPRHFLVLEDVGVMLVANQEGSNVVALGINTDGTLSPSSTEAVSLPQAAFLGRLKP